jgi:hypothetical protein
MCFRGRLNQFFNRSGGADTHRDGFPRWGMRIDPVHLKAQGDIVLEQAADLAIAVAGEVAQFRWAMEDFDGERVVRVGRFNP